MIPSSIEDILDKLHNVKQVKPNQWTADCPIEGHITPEGHLSIVDKGKKALVYCFNKHKYQDIVNKLDFDTLTYEKRIEATYDYTDEAGNLLFQVLRYKPKRFVQRRPDPENEGKYVYNLNGVKPVLYRLSEVIKSVSVNQLVVIVEGEKDVESLRKWNITATTNPGGAGKWRLEFNQYFKNARVVIIPDNDAVGYNHALHIVNALIGIAKEIFIVCIDAREAKDVSEWIEKGHTLSELQTLISKAKNYAIVPCRYLIDYIKDSLYIYPLSSQPDMERHKNVTKSVTKQSENSDGVTKIERGIGEGVTEKSGSVTYSKLIRDWVSQTAGWFTIGELDRECNIVTSKDKHNRRMVLLRLRNEGFIEKHSHREGLYRRIDKDIRIIDFKAVGKFNPLDIKFPFDIQKLVNIYAGNIIVIAGAPNAGKTAFVLNFIKLNMHNFPIYYYSSEMGEAELGLRLSKFENINIDDWSFTAYERSNNFHDVIVPDCINIIDYLEISQDFHQIANHIKLIHDKLKSGIAIIAIQKNRGADLGRGGSFSLEKARLYLTIDDGVITIRKAKNWSNPLLNPNNLKLKFKLVNGSKFEVIKDWYSDEAQWNK